MKEKVLKIKKEVHEENKETQRREYFQGTLIIRQFSKTKEGALKKKESPQRNIESSKTEKGLLKKKDCRQKKVFKVFKQKWKFSKKKRIPGGPESKRSSKKNKKKLSKYEESSKIYISLDKKKSSGKVRGFSEKKEKYPQRDSRKKKKVFKDYMWLS